MKIELSKVKPFVDRFILSSHRLDLILKDQKAVFDKTRLGYRSYDKQKSIKNLYKKSSKENMTCFHYGKVGHKSYSCKTKSTKIKQVWIIKDLINTNPKGSKIAWVPKIT